MSKLIGKKRKLPRGEESAPSSASEAKVDVFSSFFKFAIDDASRALLKQPKKMRNIVKKELPGLGNVMEFSGIDVQPPWDTKLSPSAVDWNDGLIKNFNSLAGSKLSERDQSLFDIITRYVDLQSYTTEKGHRTIYTAHILNHLIRTRNLVIRNKQTLQSAQESDSVTDDLVESLRDQGFVRPTVLILCPFKKDAYDIVQRLKALVFGDAKEEVMNKVRFENEFSSPAAPDFKTDIDDEYRELLSGNNDDCFRVGIAMSKKTLKLFEPFDKSDILLCSPLGLRMILEESAGKENHLVSSIQVTVVDGADVMLQQNWENITLIFSNLHTQPSKINTEISRVRQYYLDGDGKHFSQLMMFSRFPHELFSSLMFEHSLNHRGLVVEQPLLEGSLDKIEIPLCQELHRFDVSNPSDQSDARFHYFKEQILHTLKPHTCLVIPSYFDFVRVRNHMKRLEESFVACHEYAPKEKIARARDMFFHERKSVMLVTERYYYFNRRRIRGIDEIVFYQLPSHPLFYSSFINMARDQNGVRFKAVLLYSKFDRTRLQNTFGTEMAAGILTSEKKVQAIVSE